MTRTTVWDDQNSNAVQKLPGRVCWECSETFVQDHDLQQRKTHTKSMCWWSIWSYQKSKQWSVVDRFCVEKVNFNLMSMSTTIFAQETQLGKMQKLLYYKTTHLFNAEEKPKPSKANIATYKNTQQRKHNERKFIEFITLIKRSWAVTTNANTNRQA